MSGRITKRPFRPRKGYISAARVASNDGMVALPCFRAPDRKSARLPQGFWSPPGCTWYVGLACLCVSADLCRSARILVTSIRSGARTTCKLHRSACDVRFAGRTAETEWSNMQACDIGRTASGGNRFSLNNLLARHNFPPDAVRFAPETRNTATRNAERGTWV